MYKYSTCVHAALFRDIMCVRACVCVCFLFFFSQRLPEQKEPTRERAGGGLIHVFLLLLYGIKKSSTRFFTGLYYTTVLYYDTVLLYYLLLYTFFFPFSVFLFYCACAPLYSSPLLQKNNGSDKVTEIIRTSARRLNSLQVRRVLFYIFQP